MRLALIALLLAVPHAHAAAPADPASLFDGRSEGHGVLAFVFGHDRPFRVDNTGRRQPDGSFRLDQVIRFDGEAPRARHWIIRPAGDGRYTFTLSDAAGPGIATVDGSTLRLRYAPAHGVRMRQVLERRDDGTLANAGTISVLGIPIGHVTETIVPLP